MAHPLIIYVPGLLPKPPAAAHRDALLRCLLTGVRRVDAEVAHAIERMSGAFEIVPWTFDFYREHRDIELDRAAIDAVIEQASASARDKAEAAAWTRRLTRWIYRLGDRLPFLIPHIASERMEVHLRDLRRYVRNADGVADRIRSMLKVPLLAAAGGQNPILLIGHSMGSVICYDTLWQLSHRHGNPVSVDLWMTLGSPLGQRYMRRRIKGFAMEGRDRYPTNIRRWKNFAAAGELTAINATLADDFADMIGLGILESIEDAATCNYFRYDGELNVHSEYGYLVQEAVARAVVRWWRGHDYTLMTSG